MLSQVVAAATEAGALAMARWQGQFRRWEKAQGEPVCEIDLAVDGWADTESRPPRAPDPEQLPATDPGLVRWTSLYDMRFAEGPMPSKDGQPSLSSTTTLWVRDAAQRPVDYPALAALSDIFYPRVFLRRGGFVPSGTISLTTYFHADQHQLDGLGTEFVLCTAHANRFTRGYFDQSAQVWTRDGVLLATTHQVVYFKG